MAVYILRVCFAMDIREMTLHMRQPCFITYCTLPGQNPILVYFCILPNKRSIGGCSWGFSAAAVFHRSFHLLGLVGQGMLGVPRNIFPCLRCYLFMVIWTAFIAYVYSYFCNVGEGKWAIWAFSWSSRRCDMFLLTWPIMFACSRYLLSHCARFHGFSSPGEPCW